HLAECAGHLGDPLRGEGEPVPERGGPVGRLGQRLAVGGQDGLRRPQKLLGHGPQELVPLPAAGAREPPGCLTGARGQLPDRLDHGRHPIPFVHQSSPSRSTRLSRWISSGWGRPAMASRRASPVLARNWASSWLPMVMSPRAISRPPGSRTETKAPGPKEPPASVTPTGSRLPPRWRMASQAPASILTQPRGRSWRAIHRFRAGRPRLAGRYVPGGRPARSSSQVSDASAWANTAATPERVAMRAASSLVAMPPEPSGPA